MTTEIFERVEPWCFTHGESEAKFVLSVAEPVNATGSSAVEIRGALDGPYCTTARTLPTQYALRAGVDSTAHAFAMAQVADPCFWTPALPFLYQLDLDVTLDSRETKIDAMVGLRRWACDGASFRLNRKRVVLRGAAAPQTGESTLGIARASEAVLIVRDPPDAFCREASRHGVALIADLRGCAAKTPARLKLLAWHPSVLVALVDDRDWSCSILSPIVPASCVVKATSDAATSADRPWARALTVELHAGERPPAWLAESGKPVIAIRRGVSYADFHEARAACDQLQADLAPEFDLAGYFVAP
jgi:hypothetical protein